MSAIKKPVYSSLCAFIAYVYSCTGEGFSGKTKVPEMACCSMCSSAPCKSMAYQVSDIDVSLPFYCHNAGIYRMRYVKLRQGVIQLQSLWRMWQHRKVFLEVHYLVHVNVCVCVCVCVCVMRHHGGDTGKHTPPILGYVCCAVYWTMSAHCLNFYL